MKAYALHSIQRGKTMKPAEIKPGDVFEPADEDEEDRLTANGAIRKATSDEMKLAGLSVAPLLAKPGETGRGRRAAKVDDEL